MPDLTYLLQETIWHIACISGLMHADMMVKTCKVWKQYIRALLPAKTIERLELLKRSFLNKSNGLILRIPESSKEVPKPITQLYGCFTVDLLVIRKHPQDSSVLISSVDEKKGTRFVFGDMMVKHALFRLSIYEGEEIDLSNRSTYVLHEYYLRPSLEGNITADFVMITEDDWAKFGKVADYKHNYGVKTRLKRVNPICLHGFYVNNNYSTLHRLLLSHELANLCVAKKLGKFI